MRASTAHRSSTVEVDTKLPLGLLKVLLLGSRLPPQKWDFMVWFPKFWARTEGTPQIAENPSNGRKNVKF